jgi:hypothetical protein
LSKTPFATIMLDGFLSSIQGSSLTNWLPFALFFVGLGVTNNAAKPDCILPIGDYGSLIEGFLFGKLIIIKINETLLFWKQQSCQKCKHRQPHFDFPNTASKKKSTWVSLFKRNNLLAKLCFS